MNKFEPDVTTLEKEKKKANIIKSLYFIYSR